MCFRWKRLQASLHHMVPVRVLGQSYHSTFQSSHKPGHMGSGLHDVNELLHSTSSVHVERDADQGVAGFVQDKLQLRGCAHVHELLAKVVPEWIHHQLHTVRQNLAKDGIHDFRITLLQFVLQHAATSLVSRNSVYIVDKGVGGKDILQVRYLETSTGRLLLSWLFPLSTSRSSISSGRRVSAGNRATSVGDAIHWCTGHSCRHSVPGHTAREHPSRRVALH
mmetsp:Transcript_76527/g.177582  ORF Transcript_76527/g.177582 Transcript_76527/m.177582 type:complete len:222 (+) Transcript_76527:1017-1682(+)